MDQACLQKVNKLIENLELHLPAESLVEADDLLTDLTKQREMLSNPSRKDHITWTNGLTFAIRYLKTVADGGVKLSKDLKAAHVQARQMKNRARLACGADHCVKRMSKLPAGAGIAEAAAAAKECLDTTNTLKLPIPDALAASLNALAKQVGAAPLAPSEPSIKQERAHPDE